MSSSRRADPSKTVPVVEGLFTWSSDSPKLMGTKCLSCGNYYFPKKISCNNPDCKEKKIEDVLLSRQGKLYSYSVQYYPPPPPFKFDEPFTPYGIGLVELPEGIRVVGMMTTNDLDEMKIGMNVELVAEKLYTDDEGNDAVTYKFKPLSQKREE